jgi:hypothetical protein
MKHVEIAELITAVPIQMTRREKLLRWADLIRKQERSLVLVHGLEYMQPRELERYRIRPNEETALGVAAADPKFRAQGLGEMPTLGEALRFFALAVGEAHAFSCDCGGYIDNREQAARIEALAI